MKYLHLLIFLWFSPFSNIEAQILYACTFQGTGNQILEIDLDACVATPLVAVPPTPVDMCIAPNGLFYIINTGIDISSVDPVTGIVTPVATLPNITASGLEWGEDGFIYAIAHVIFKINPTTGVVQNMGQFPPGWVSTGELVYHNGIYYGAMNTPQGWRLVNVNLNTPAASTVITNMPLPFVGGGAINHPTCPKLWWIELNTTADTRIWEYDINAQSWAIICDNIPFVLGGGDTPNDYTFPISCPCTTDAGVLSGSPIQVCLPLPASFTPPTQVNLEPDDLLQYVLYTNVNDPEGSILATSNTPNFDFNPATMQTGLTYYVAAVAGNNVNGNVDLSDPCLDFSNALTVIWQPTPTVTFTVASPEVCAGDCLLFNVDFTGTAPFNLTYTVGSGGNQTQNFATNTGTLVVCPPAGLSGEIIMNAEGLSDTNCVCD